MTLLLLLLFPLLIGVAGLLIGKGRITWKEFALQETIIVFIISIGYLIALSNRSSDIEHWNGVITTKTKDVVGCCHPYCCSWGTCCSGSGKDLSCSPCCQAWCNLHSNDIAWNSWTSNSEHVFHDGCNPPGTSPPERWNRIVLGEPTSVEHGFTNYIKGNPDSILRRQGLSEKWKNLLPAYPRVFDHYYANKFIGGNSLANERLAKLNARLGARREVNMIVVVTKTPDREFKEALKEHWLGGKKNDLILIVGVPYPPQIAWADVLTWSKAEEMNITIRDSVQKLAIYDPEKILDILEREVSTKFVIRNWEEFDYLKSTIEPSSNVQIFLFIFGMIVSCVLWGVMHHHDVFNEEFVQSSLRDDFYSRYTPRRRP